MNSSTEQPGDYATNNHGRNDEWLARLKDALHRTWPVAVFSVELLVLALGGLKLWDSLAPDPVLVYANEYRPTPRNVTYETTFKNVNKNWPLENLTAKWELEADDVELNISPNAPQYAKDKPQPNIRLVRLLQPLAAYAQFTAFLQAGHSFQIFRQELDAEFPKVDRSGVKYQKVDVLSEAQWAQQNGPPYLVLLSFFAVLLLVVISGYKILGLFTRKA